MCLKLPLGLILMWVCCASGVVDIEAKHFVKHVHTWMRAAFADTMCQDFCTPVINEVSSGNQEEMQEGKFGGRTHVQKNFGYCLFLL